MNLRRILILLFLAAAFSCLGRATALEVDAFTAEEVLLFDGVSVEGELTGGIRFVIPAPDAGTVDRLTVAEGDRIERGTAIGNIADGYPPFSPASGRIAEVRVARGDLVEAGQVLATVESGVRLSLEFGLPTQFRASFTRGTPVSFRLPDAPDRLFKGAFVDAGLQYSPELKGTRAVAMVDNPEGELQPGTRVEVILSGNPRLSLRIPKSALIPNASIPVAWKIVEGDGGPTVEPTPLRTGIDLDDEMVEVTGGLLLGDRVVADLAGHRLSPGASVVIRTDAPEASADGPEAESPGDPEPRGE